MREKKQGKPSFLYQCPSLLMFRHSPPRISRKKQQQQKTVTMKGPHHHDYTLKEPDVVLLFRFCFCYLCSCAFANLTQDRSPLQKKGRCASVVGQVIGVRVAPHDSRAQRRSNAPAFQDTSRSLLHAPNNSIPHTHIHFPHCVFII